MRFALAGILLAGALSASAQKTAEFNIPVDHFQGEDVYQDSARLSPNQSQDAHNVLTEHGFVEKRPGSILAGNFINAVENMTEFVKLGGTRFMVGHSSAGLYYTDFGETPVLYSTSSASVQVSFVNAFNKVISVDGVNEVEFDGNSATTALGFPQCALVEYAYDRIWCSGILNESLSRVRISSVANDTGWVVPANPNIIANAPYLFDINRDDGQSNTCMKNTPWGVVIGKQRSMWVIKGYDNTNWYVRNIDPAIGCVDSRSMQMVDGRLQWLAADGVYSWNGAVGGAVGGANLGGGALKLESLPIDSIVKSARQSSSQKKSWALQSQSDWLSGLFVGAGTTTALSANIVIGSIVPSSATMIDNTVTALSSGTLINISTNVTTGNPTVGSLGLVASTDSVYTSSTNWQVPFANGGAPSLYFSSITIGANSNNPAQSFSTAFDTFTIAYGTFSFSENCAMTAGTGFRIDMYFIALSSNSTGTGITTSGYGIQINSSDSSQRLCRYTNGSCTTLLTMANYTQGRQDWTVYRDPLGNFTVSLVGPSVAQKTLYGPVKDNTYTTNAYTGIDIGGSNVNPGNLSFQENTLAYVHSGTFTSRGYDTEFSTPVWGNFNARLSSSADSGISFYTQSSADGVTWDNRVSATPGAQVASANKEFIRYVAVMTDAVTIATKTPSLISNSINSATTGYFYSPVDFVGVDISSWDFLDVGSVIPNGSTITFGIRQATYSFSIGIVGISSTTMAPNSLIPLTVTTPTYVQHIEYFQFNNADAVPSLNLVRVNWKTGLPVSSAASGYLNHRYFLCIAISSNTNDTCLVQQRTRDWVIFQGQSIGAMSLFNNQLYGGSGLTDGSVWREMQDGIYTDAGVPIDSWWTSPDYTFVGPDNPDAGITQKAVNEMWFDAQPSSATFLNIGYSVDKSTTFVNKVLDLSPATMVNKRVPMNASFALGKYFRLRMENSQNAYWRVNGFNIIGQFKPRTDY